jgi:uncharacterized membrane protein
MVTSSPGCYEHTTYVVNARRSPELLTFLRYQSFSRNRVMSGFALGNEGVRVSQDLAKSIRDEIR